MAVKWDYFDKFDELSDKYLQIEEREKQKLHRLLQQLASWFISGTMMEKHLIIHTILMDGVMTYQLMQIGLQKYLLKELADSLLEEEYLSQQNEFEKSR